MVDAAKITNNKISKFLEKKKSCDDNEVINEVINNELENVDETSSLKLSDESDSSDSEN